VQQPRSSLAEPLVELRQWAAAYGPDRETLTLIESRTCAARELAAGAGVTPVAMGTRLRPLHQAGLVDPVEPLRSHLQRYVLTARGTRVLRETPVRVPAPEDGGEFVELFMELNPK
jgi:hypothetical protein